MFDGCEIKAQESLAGKCVAFATSATAPVGIRGTTLKFKATQGTTYMIFVGGLTSTEAGIVHVNIMEAVDDNGEDDGGLSGWEIFGIVVAVVFIVIILIALLAFGGYLAYFFYKKHKGLAAFQDF